MVKPAGAYLDVLREIRERTELPLGAYQVSGEYAMIKFAAMAGAIDEEKSCWKVWARLNAPGADLIFSYFALDLAEKKYSALILLQGGALPPFPDFTPHYSVANANPLPDAAYPAYGYSSIAWRICCNDAGSSMVVRSPGSRPSQIAWIVRRSIFPERVLGAARQTRHAPDDQSDQSDCLPAP
ncbi:delta-aminolevulinic acid dehydratase [Salmonella enterica subsp. enterica]|uniref:Delta-aminolevulinic acid dehydratase n=1 Tax=Salmonella enterica I TaxID=59201 RepID=A0A379WDU9_SALET|nr:delta-aminolevulinic acid dehydratase [Salmonella enterica subsp. enterica]